MRSYLQTHKKLVLPPPEAAEENEPLLEDAEPVDRADAALEEEQTEIEDEALQAKVEAAKDKSGFYYDMLRTLEVLVNKKRQLKHGPAAAPLIRRFHIASTLLLLLIATLIVVPTVFWGYVINTLKISYDKLLNETLTYMARTQANIDSLEHGIEELTDEAATSRKTLFGYLKSMFENWWTLRDGVNCEGSTGQKTEDMIDFNSTDSDWITTVFCDYLSWFGSNPPLNKREHQCEKIAREGCVEILLHHAQDINELKDTEEKLTNAHTFLNEDKALLHRQQSHLESGILGDVIYNDTVHTGLGITAACLSGVGILISLLLLCVYQRQRAIYKREKRAIYNIGDKIPELVASLPADTQTILTKLGVTLSANLSIDDLTDDFVVQLRKSIKEDEERWKCVIAFMSGKRDPNSHVFRFFNRDVCIRLLKEAGLGPRYRPENGEIPRPAAP